jgi:hypothetical protein
VPPPLIDRASGSEVGVITTAAASAMLHSFYALGDYLAFRDLFRETAVTLMRWDKLAPLLARVPEVTGELTITLAIFAHHLASSGDAASPPL